LGCSPVFVACVIAAVGCLLPGRAVAKPILRAELTWRGECEDLPALLEEMRARDADLQQPAPEASVLRVAVEVQRQELELVAELELTDPTWHEVRTVEARDCAALRRAVAWVLAVLAEEREAATQPLVGQAHGALPAAPLAEPRHEEPRVAPPQLEVVSTQPATRAVPLSGPCTPKAPQLQLASEVVGAGGLVDSLAMGPALVVRYRSCARSWPGVSVGAVHLLNVDYSLDSRSISLRRTAAQLGAWVPVGWPTLRGGLSVELGVIRASAVATAAGPGGSGSATWLAFVAPWRWSQLLLGKRLSFELGLDVVYAPLGYELRYKSFTQPLALTSHFELRGAIGLAGHL
jgi:hypothetical protein